MQQKKSIAHSPQMWSATTSAVVKDSFLLEARKSTAFKVMWMWVNVFEYYSEMIFGRNTCNVDMGESHKTQWKWQESNSYYP